MTNLLTISFLMNSTIVNYALHFTFSFGGCMAASTLYLPIPSVVSRDILCY